MRVELILLGKTSETWVKEAMGLFSGRIIHYIEFAVQEIPVPKRISTLPQRQQQQEEAKLLLKHLESFDRVVLLDEKGTEMNSVGFSAYLQKIMNSGVKRLAFVAGGAYGFGEDILAKDYNRISLSKMTFSHQMVRVFFTEQLYRALTILRGEKYHHD